MSSNLCPNCFLPNTGELMAHWPFNGTLDDISTFQVGKAVVDPGSATSGSETGFHFDNSMPLNPSSYLKLRAPGYFTIPATTFIETNGFTVTWEMRLVEGPNDSVNLLTNWGPGDNLQFMIRAEYDGSLLCSLIQEGRPTGSGPIPNLSVKSEAGTISAGKWFNVAFSYDMDKRTLCVYINGIKSGETSMDSSIPKFNIVHSDASVYCFGSHREYAQGGGTVNVGKLDADIRHLRFFKLHASSA